MTEGYRDLFGFPGAPFHRGPGRPEHAPNDRTRAEVRRMREAGAGQREIAAWLRITLPTLRRHYRAELQAGACSWRADRRERGA